MRVDEETPDDRLARMRMWRAARELFGSAWCRSVQEACEEAQQGAVEPGGCKCASLVLDRLPVEAFQ